MKYVSWNVNGLRACIKKGFFDYFKEADADAFCLQETKLQEGQVDIDKDSINHIVLALSYKDVLGIDRNADIINKEHICLKRIQKRKNDLRTI